MTFYCTGSLRRWVGWRESEGVETAYRAEAAALNVHENERSCPSALAIPFAGASVGSADFKP